jgi:hypothetical protein
MTKNIQRLAFLMRWTTARTVKYPTFYAMRGSAEIRKNCNTALSQASRLLADRSNCSMKPMEIGLGARHAFKSEIDVV